MAGQADLSTCIQATTFFPFWVRLQARKKKMEPDYPLFMHAPNNLKEITCSSIVGGKRFIRIYTIAGNFREYKFLRITNKHARKKIFEILTQQSHYF